VIALTVADREAIAELLAARQAKTEISEADRKRFDAYVHEALSPPPPLHEMSSEGRHAYSCEVWDKVLGPDARRRSLGGTK